MGQKWLLYNADGLDTVLSIIRGMAMIKFNMMVFMLLVACGINAVYAEDAANEMALQQSLECLKTQTCAKITTPAGQAADLKALEAVGGDAAKKQELYNISADIMPFLMQQAGSDPNKMQEIMLKAQTDPEAFLNSLPADVRARIANAAKGAAADAAAKAKP